MRFVRTQDFEKDISKLKINLEKDFEIFKKALSVSPVNLSGVFRIQGLGEDVYPVFKVKKFRCKALNKGSKSGIRIIYTYDSLCEEIHFIAIYH